MLVSLHAYFVQDYLLARTKITEWACHPAEKMCGNELNLLAKFFILYIPVNRYSIMLGQVEPAPVNSGCVY